MSTAPAQPPMPPQRRSLSFDAGMADVDVGAVGGILPPPPPAPLAVPTVPAPSSMRSGGPPISASLSKSRIAFADSKDETLVDTVPTDIAAELPPTLISMTWELTFTFATETSRDIGYLLTTLKSQPSTWEYALKRLTKLVDVEIVKYGRTSWRGQNALLIRLKFLANPGDSLDHLVNKMMQIPELDVALLVGSATEC